MCSFVVVLSPARLGFLSEVGDGGVQSLNTPRGKHRESSGSSSGGSKSGGGQKVSALDTGLGENYGSAVDAHKSELEKAAMRQRIRELEEELLNANSKSKACVLL